MSTRIRTLIVDDEGPARSRLRAMISRDVLIEIVGECSDGRTAVKAIAEHRPDLVFLDVQMPLLDGFGVVQAVGASQMPPVIFVSAYSDFAVRAFEAYALDYVLKPYDEARLMRALARATEVVIARRASLAASDDGVRLSALLAQLAQPAVQRYPDSLAVKLGDSYNVLRVADIDWIEADGNYSRLHVLKAQRLITKSLARLERDVLDPERFLRTHRSAIVNIAKVVTVEPLFHGDVLLILQNGMRVSCSRRYRDRLQERLYFTT